MPKKKSSAIRALPAVMHIYCEGEKTEPNYINKYIAGKFTDRRRKVVQVEATKKNTPIQLVEVALQHKNSHDCPNHDEFWVVYDREAPAKYLDELHKKALDLAVKNNINVALSNVCFELWLLLHFKGNTAPYASYNDLMASSDFRSELLKAGISDYEKGNTAIFDVVLSRLNTAKTRAIAMNQHTLSSAANGKNKPYQLNPYTDVYLLFDAIDGFK